MLETLSRLVQLLLLLLLLSIPGLQLRQNCSWHIGYLRDRHGTLPLLRLPCCHIANGSLGGFARRSWATCVMAVGSDFDQVAGAQVGMRIHNQHIVLRVQQG